ncbi:MAG: ParB/RepB/Spo0J family partition protein [Candidatus Paceibacterota bacterium]
MAFQGDSIFWVEVEKVVPNPFQPRREFDVEKLKELSESIRMYGVLQPLTVTRKEVQREDGTFYTEYELIAGERRLRASKLAGLHQVPVIIREGEDSEQEKLELAIIENLQREDLNAVDRALAFKQLSDTFGLSHTLVAKKVGRSREYVSNSIRLLALPEQMLDALKRGDMTEGHARTLLMLNDKPQEQDVIFREILLKKLSVREVERIVRKIATDKVRKKNPHEFDDDVIEMEKRFMETLGTRVQILKTDYGGRLTIDYFSPEDLEDMLQRMKRDEAVASLGATTTDIVADSLNKHTPLNVQEVIKDDSLQEKTTNSPVDNNSSRPSLSGAQDNDQEKNVTQNTDYPYNYYQDNKPEDPKPESLLEDPELVNRLESRPDYKKIEEPEEEEYLPAPAQEQDTTLVQAATPVQNQDEDKSVFSDYKQNQDFNPMVKPENQNQVNEDKVAQNTAEVDSLKTINTNQVVEQSQNNSEVLTNKASQNLDNETINQNTSQGKTTINKAEDESDLYSIRNFTV